MFNVTFNNNKILKIYDSNENIVTGILTLRFFPSDYSFDTISSIFEKFSKEDLQRIIKSTSTANYVTTFSSYTNVVGKSIEKVDVQVEKIEEIPTLDKDGQEVITNITTTEYQQIELIVVTLKYEDPTKILVDKLNQQINPNIDFETCSLDELKAFVQKKNSEALELFLEKNPLLYNDNKYYGVSKVDRDEMTQQYLAYQLNKTMNPNAEDVVKWHSKGTKCTLMSVSDFAALAIAVYTYAEPYYEKMQEIKEMIMTSETKEDVLKIKLFGE